MNERSMTGSTSPRPLSIKVIAFIILAESLLIVLALLTVPPDRQVWGIAGSLHITGRFAFLCNIGWVLFMPCLGIGIWSQRELARRVVVVLSGLRAFGISLEFIIPSLRAATAEEFVTEVGVSHATATFAVLSVVVVGVFLECLIIWFLIKWKSVFVK